MSRHLTPIVVTLVPVYDVRLSGREFSVILKALRKYPGRDAEDITLALEEIRNKCAADYAARLDADTKTSRAARGIKLEDEK